MNYGIAGIASIAQRNLNKTSYRTSTQRVSWTRPTYSRKPAPLAEEPRHPGMALIEHQVPERRDLASDPAGRRNCYGNQTGAEKPRLACLSRVLFGMLFRPLKLNESAMESTPCSAVASSSRQEFLVFCGVGGFVVNPM